MDKELYLHLGLPKTGTTTLQNRIFPNHEEYLYLGKETPVSDFRNEENQWTLSLRQNLVCKDLPYFMEFDLEELFRNKFGKDYDNFSKHLFSEENILSRCITPTTYGKYKRVGSAYAISQKLKFLLERTSYSSVKLIFVTRKQDDLVESMFAETYYIIQKHMGLKTPDEFVKYLFNEGLMEETESLFRYYSLIKYFDSIFGEENVLVLPYEKMKSDPEVFMSEISSFMQISLWENVHLLNKVRDNSRDPVSRSGKVAKVEPLTRKLALIKNRIIGNVPTNLHKKLNFINKFQKTKIVKLDEPTKKKILHHYREENQKLIERVKYVSESGYILD